MNKMKRVLDTSPSISLAVLRCTLGVVIFAHGAQKMLGWFGGHGFSWTLDAFNQWFGFPVWVTFLVIIGEFFGSLALIFGFLTRVMAGAIGLIMIGAIIFVHNQGIFFMNWYGGAQRIEGIEFHLLVFAMVFALIAKGGGRFSIDRALSEQLN